MQIVEFAVRAYRKAQNPSPVCRWLLRRVGSLLPVLFLAPLLVPLLVLQACSDNDNNSVAPAPVPTPIVEGPILPAGEFFVGGTAFDPAEAGYRVDEYFVSGTARSYVNTNDFGQDGKWEVTEAEIGDYVTRILVYRPLDAAQFSGTVHVEWYNVSAGLDASPDWLLSHVETLRSGHAYVGVSAQKAGVEGSGGGFGLHLKAVNPDRYGPLVHPGDSFSYDMFSQAMQAVLTPSESGVAPLDGLQADVVIAGGHSQSGIFMTTYVNAFAGLHGVADGYIIHGRSFSSAPLSQEPQATVNSPPSVHVRDDLQQPVLTLQTETDLFRLGSLADRQADTALHRLWEIAGSSHFDLYGLRDGATDIGGDPSVANVEEEQQPIPGFISCPLPINAGPQHWVYKAGLAGIERWIREGEPLPHAARLEIVNGQLVLDELGNALGGIRSPYVDAPVALLSGLGQMASGFCSLFGITQLFDETTLAQLYATHEDYVAAVRSATESAVGEGFILPADAALIIAAAEQSSVRR